MNAERKPVDTLNIINRVAIFNGGPIASDLCLVGERFEELIEAAQSRVAASFDEAAAAHERGEHLAWCEVDALNPCWMPSMPITAPLRHWGYTEGVDGECLACSDCRLRAALVACRGSTPA